MNPITKLTDGPEAPFTWEDQSKGFNEPMGLKYGTGDATFTVTPNTSTHSYTAGDFKEN